MELTRFYLELKKDPHGPETALFVGNMPPNLSQRQYEDQLLDMLEDGSKFHSIGPIYYEYGSMVITFDNSESALNALDQLKVSKQEYEGGKKILGESMTQIQYAYEC